MTRKPLLHLFRSSNTYSNISTETSNSYGHCHAMQTSPPCGKVAFHGEKVPFLPDAKTSVTHKLEAIVLQNESKITRRVSMIQERTASTDKLRCCKRPMDSLQFPCFTEFFPCRLSSHHRRIKAFFRSSDAWLDSFEFPILIKL